MISVDELLYEFELKLNSLNRESNQNMFLENKLIYLNNAQMTWVKSKMNPNNIYKVGYEGMRKRIEDLQVLKINDKRLQVDRTDNKRYLGYSSDLTSVTDYMFYVTSYAVASTTACNATMGVNLIKEGELETQYYNENYAPSFKWRDTIATIGNNKLYVYVDDAESFKIDELAITYLRKPKSIDKEGYVKFDGSDSVNQDCELPEYAKNDIVDLAVKYAAQATDNISQVQMAKEREQNNE